MGLFNWDPNKNASNKKKHGISFEDARSAFSDPNKKTRKAPAEKSHGEDRDETVGFADSIKKLLFIASTERDNPRHTRIISARKPSNKESRWYNGE